MIRAITYNCTPDSLGDVSQEAFVDAFENEMRAKLSFGDISIEVTFDPATRSEVTKWSSDDLDADSDLEDTFCEQIDRIAERAFNACLVTG